MSPVESRRLGTVRPVRLAMISAQMLTAVSSGVLAPMSRPIGDIKRSRSAAAATPTACRRSIRPRVRGAAAHHADVAHAGRQRALNCRNIELRIVCEDADGIPRPQLLADLVEDGRRPRDPDSVRHREAASGGEHFAGVADRHPVAEHLGDPGERCGEVDRSEDPHLWWRRMRFDEDPDRRLVEQILRGGLTLRSVIAYPGAGRFEFPQRVAGDDPVEFGVAERSQRFDIGLNEELRAELRSIDDRRQRDRRLAAQQRRITIEDRHQSSSSM